METFAKFIQWSGNVALTCSLAAALTISILNHRAQQRPLEAYQTYEPWRVFQQ